METTDSIGGSSHGTTKCYKKVSHAGIIVFFFVALFSVLLWDIRKVHKMSIIIHDDHTSHWIQMRPSDLTKWLAPVDICMLNVSSPDTDLYQYRKKNCSKLIPPKASVPLHLTCGIGSSIGGKVCLPPLNTRSFFTAQLRHPLLGNASNQLLRSSLREFAVRSKPVVFVGDGISKQNTDALLCEIMRTDLVTLEGTNGPIDANYTIRWKASKLKLDVHYMKLTNMYDNGENEVAEARRIRRARRKAMGNITDPANASNATKVALSMTLPAIQARVQRIIESHGNGIVLVVNVGVWYNSRELFRTELPDLLSWMNELSAVHNSTVYFRETAAQHWNHTASGYFDKNYAEARWDNGTCTPVGDATPEFDWRNTDVYHIITNGAFTNIHLMPFRDITLPLYNMHPSSSVVSARQHEDCTHYCYFPQMWQTIWFHLYEAAFGPQTPIDFSFAAEAERRRLRKG